MDSRLAAADPPPRADEAAAVFVGAGDGRQAGGLRPPLPSPLDEVLAATAATRSPGDPHRTRLDSFLAEVDPLRALALWLGLRDTDGPRPTRAEITRRLSRDIARLDDLIAAQTNAIIHQTAFQRLEASWRGLAYLIAGQPDDGSVIVRILNASWADIVQDQARALEFDQSQLFRKVYEAEFGHPGGKPFGILLGDYEIHHRPGPGHPHDDLDALSRIAGVSAAAFAPFLTAVHPSFFGFESFAQLERPLDLARIFEQQEYLKWRALRQAPDGRFVGLLLPRVLLRVPYGAPGAPHRPSAFPEDVEGPDRERYLWGNPVYALGAVVMRSFVAMGWPADIRGVRQAGREGEVRTLLDEGGLVTGLPVHSFGTDRPGLATRCSTEVIVTDTREKELDELGFIALCHCQGTDFSAFYGNSSIQKPERYTDPQATVNARMSAMIQYMLCVSRFAHYLKVMARDRIGSISSPEECEEQLSAWLRNYTIGNDSGGPEQKARYPLREAKVTVREHPDKPGCYYSVIHLRPHYQLDQMFTSLKLTTELAPGRPE